MAPMALVGAGSNTLALVIDGVKVGIPAGGVTKSVLVDGTSNVVVDLGSQPSYYSP